MRVINLNGYIDEEVWYGDEITPDILHDQLFAEGEDHSLPVRIILNSYGGSCNAAVRMFDDVRAYDTRADEAYAIIREGLQDAIDNL